MKIRKLVVFDLDGTLTPRSTWADFNALLGITPQEDMMLFESYANGIITYDEWISKLVDLYKQGGSPVSEAAIEKLACEIPFREGAAELVASLKEKGYDILLLSGSVDAITKHIALRLGIDAWRACSVLEFDATRMLKDIRSIGDEGPAKLALLSAYCAEHGYAMDEVTSIGDGRNDLEIFQHTAGIMLGNSHHLQQAAWKQADTLAAIDELL